MKMRKIAALAAASMLALGVVGVASAASVPTQHSATIAVNTDDNCPDAVGPLVNLTNNDDCNKAVSYTHLTLPTIYSV